MVFLYSLILWNFVCFVENNAFDFAGHKNQRSRFIAQAVERQLHEA